MPHALLAKALKHAVLLAALHVLRLSKVPSVALACKALENTERMCVQYLIYAIELRNLWQRTRATSSSQFGIPCRK